MSRLPADSEQIFSILRRLKQTSPLISIARHIDLATRHEGDLFYVSDKEFLDILEQYELENTLDPIEQDSTEEIIDEATNHFDELTRKLLEDKEDECS